ncbi:hypothetical protein VE04_01378 [Pseudogymnoascus sp. 24MN13]|nr:hypothetical protein VE04_01378 [Pseudogymnoascus sp. 24MN13]
MDFRSPGAVNLREVFDVGYAVHRQEEEAKRRKNLMGRGLEPIGDENEGGMQGVEQGLRNTSLSAAATARQQAQPQAKGYGQHSAAVAAAARQQVKNQRGPFELNLDGATLLGRRGQKGPTSGLRESTTVQ